MRILLIITLLTFSGFSSGAPLKCDYKNLGKSFLGSETIPFLKVALKYQNFDFSSIRNVYAMQKVIKEKDAIKSIYKLYENSPFIWGERYNKMYPLCDEKQKETIFAKAFTYYEFIWGRSNAVDVTEHLEYIMGFEFENHKSSKTFGIRSYKHFMSIFETAIENIEDNTNIMWAALKEKRESTKKENKSLEEKAKKINDLVAKQEAANHQKKKLLAEIEAKQRRLSQLQAENKRINNSSKSSFSENSGPSTIGNRTIKRDSIVCYSEAAYDRQMDAIAQDDWRLFAGCEVIGSSIKGWFDDISIFSGTCILWNSNRSGKLWVNCENVTE